MEMGGGHEEPTMRILRRGLLLVMAFIVTFTVTFVNVSNNLVNSGVDHTDILISEGYRSQLVQV